MEPITKVVNEIHHVITTTTKTQPPGDKGQGQGKKNKPGPHPNQSQNQSQSQGQGQGQRRNPNPNQNQSGSSGPGSGPGQNPHYKKQQGGGKPGGPNETQNAQSQGKQNYQQRPKQYQNQGPGQNQGQNQGQGQQSQQKYGPPAGKQNYPQKNYPARTNFKTGLGQGRGKKYDTNTCLFVSGMEIPENKSALRVLEDLMIDDMALDFRPLEIIKLEPPASEEDDEDTSGRTLVAIFTNPVHVQEILNKAPAFKSSPENLTKYGNIQFEGYLTKDEQTVKKAMSRRVRELNKQIAAVENAGELGLEAKILSRNSYQHMGIQYLGFLHNDNTILWKSYQPLRQTRKNTKSDGNKEGGAGGGGGDSTLYGSGQLQPQSPTSTSTGEGEGDEFTVLGLPDVPSH